MIRVKAPDGRETPFVIYELADIFPNGGAAYDPNTAANPTTNDVIPAGSAAIIDFRGEHTGVNRVLGIEGTYTVTNFAGAVAPQPTIVFHSARCAWTSPRTPGMWPPDTVTTVNRGRACWFVAPAGPLANGTVNFFAAFGACNLNSIQAPQIYSVGLCNVNAFAAPGTTITIDRLTITTLQPGPR